MNMYDIIAKKRDGKKLSYAEISYFVNQYVLGAVKDYQASALLMAIYLRGLDDYETAHLTRSMAESGDMINLDSLGLVADKHSTGGVSDSTTLIVLPLVCACGLKMAKMSGRGLGHTGGTIDKLEAIAGFNTSFDINAFMSQMKSTGCAITAQTPRLCPADKLLYSLRNVTATVGSIPLIASSIMSKKLAMGAHIIVLDVKTGNGAFMKNLSGAQKLAKTMVNIGRGAGRRTCAIISDMNQPLGNAIGNALEVKEAIDILSGAQDGGDLLKVSMTIASKMLCLAQAAKNEADAAQMLKYALNNKSALRKLSELIKAQNGDVKVIDNTSYLPAARITASIAAQKSGCLSAVDCVKLGEAAGVLGAGRAHKDDIIDPAVGLVVKKRIGDTVKKGDILAELHANDESLMLKATERLENCFTVSQKARPVKLIHEVID
ncbi:MAG: thymidine phosphorylase [Christensenellales bacterium]